VVSGDGQTGNIGELLTDPIQVLITNQFDLPLPGFLVDFSISTGGGMLKDNGPTTSAPTDGSGVADVTWTLGPDLGQQSLLAQTIAFSPLVTQVTAVAEEAAPAVSFAVTSVAVGPTADMVGACAGEFGAAYSIADWNDVADAVASGRPKEEILSTGVAMILNNGVGSFTPMFQPTQHHMISAVGPGVPNLGTIGTDLFWLTSGTGDQRVLCMGPSS
jgi:hypothetical protein